MAPPRTPNCRDCGGPNEFHGQCWPCKRKSDNKRKRAKTVANRKPCVSCGLKPMSPAARMGECEDCQAIRRKASVMRQRQRDLRHDVCKCGCGREVAGRTRYATKDCYPKPKQYRGRPGVKRPAVQAPRWVPPKKPVDVRCVVVNPGVEVKRYEIPWSRWG